MRLFDRGFPRPDIDTGMYDFDAIDAWRRLRHPQLFTANTAADPTMRECCGQFNLRDTLAGLIPVPLPATFVAGDEDAERRTERRRVSSARRYCT
jgi:hypothetical protein